jgi:hypothetical protein
VSDDQPTEALTGEVRTSVLMTRENGGALQSGGAVRPRNPTPNDVKDLCRKRVYQLIPELNRIGKNKPSKRKDGPNKVADQLRAIEILMRGATDDAISASDLRRALKGFSEAVLRKYPGPIGEDVLSIAAPFFFSL